MNYTMIDKSTYDDILELIENEGDWPMRSGYTGFEKDSKEGPVRSNPTFLTLGVYKYMVERNRCNRNDYQNIAKNGAQSENTVKYVKAIRRNANDDHPLLVFLELIGLRSFVTKRKRYLQGRFLANS
jgi:acyloxyacyl hydrolase